jgi:biopolymer transport protein ExbB
MSVASWYIILWKGFKLHKEYNRYKEFQLVYARIPDWARHELPKNVTGSIGALLNETEKLASVLIHYDQMGRKELLTMHLSQSLDIIRGWFDKGLTILASIGSTAPFIGLFGTVWGIYGALTKIAAEGNAGLNVVAGPMGEALVATAIGLFAAIPAVLAYNSFVRLNRVLVQNLRHVAEQITAYTSLHTIPHEAEKIKPIKGTK